MEKSFEEMMAEQAALLAEQEEADEAASTKAKADLAAWKAEQAKKRISEEDERGKRADEVVQQFGRDLAAGRKTLADKLRGLK